MSTTTLAPPRRPLACILTLLTLVGCWYFYTTDEEHYLLFLLFLVTQLVVHVTLRCKQIDAVLALTAFMLLLWTELHLSYYRDGIPSMLRQSHVRTIILAMHDYHKEHSKLLTSNVLSASGRPLLSWRVALLPHLGEDDLYRQFKLDEPWSSSHNIKLLEKIPKCYRSLRKRAPLGHTQIAALTGPGTIFSEKVITLGQVTAADGISQTAVLAESGRFIPWTMPDDELVDDSIPPYLNAFPGTSRITTLGFLDGYVKSIRDDRQLENTKLRKLVTWKGGEEVGNIDDYLSMW